MTAFERFVTALESHGSPVVHRGPDQVSACCPAHADSSPSLSVRRIEGQALVYCHAGCSNPGVVDALGMTMADLYDKPRGATYTYPDGRRVHRTPDKVFRQSGTTKGTALFRVENVAAAIQQGRRVYVTEGEKDVLAIESAGGVAVCSAMGAGKADRFDWSPLRGADVVIVADRDEPGRKHAAQVAKILDGIAATVAVVESAAGKDSADHIAAGNGLDGFVPVEHDKPQLSVTRLADVQPERVTWLWPGRIPAGKLCTLDGDPSLGKSTLALTFAAIITTGGRWPDGTGCAHPGDVILLSAEDGLADTIRPRADAAGADVARIHAVQGVTIPGTSPPELRPPTLGDVDQLGQLVRRTRARLLIIDVLMAYLPSGTDSHKDQDIRRVLSRLSALADETGCTILLLRHLNKAKGGDPMYRGGGSIGIVGAARAGMLVAADPDDDELRVLASTKSNLGPAPEALAYRLVNADHHGVARVEWTGTSTHDARSLLADRVPDRDGASASEPVITWLLDYLKSGAQKATEVYAAADAIHGYSKDQVKRAKARINADGEVIETYQPKIPGPWYWRQTHTSTAADDDGGGDVPPSPNTPLPGSLALPGRSEAFPQGAQGGAPLPGALPGETAASAQVRGTVEGDPTPQGARERETAPLGRTCPECGLDSLPAGRALHHDCERKRNDRQRTEGQLA